MVQCKCVCLYDPTHESLNLNEWYSCNSIIIETVW